MRPAKPGQKRQLLWSSPTAKSQPQRSGSASQSPPQAPSFWPFYSCPEANSASTVAPAPQSKPDSQEPRLQPKHALEPKHPRLSASAQVQVLPPRACQHKPPRPRQPPNIWLSHGCRRNPSYEPESSRLHRPRKLRLRAKSSRPASSVPRPGTRPSTTPESTDEAQTSNKPQLSSPASI